MWNYYYYKNGFVSIKYTYINGMEIIPTQNHKEIIIEEE